MKQTSLEINVRGGEWLTLASKIINDWKSRRGGCLASEASWYTLSCEEEECGLVPIPLLLTRYTKMIGPC
jgi:hypothetical protein